MWDQLLYRVLYRETLFCWVLGVYLRELGCLICAPLLRDCKTLVAFRKNLRVFLNCSLLFKHTIPQQDPSSAKSKTPSLQPRRHIEPMTYSAVSRWSVFKVSKSSRKTRPIKKQTPSSFDHDRRVKRKGGGSNVLVLAFGLG